MLCKVSEVIPVCSLVGALCVGLNLSLTEVEFEFLSPGTRLLKTVLLLCQLDK
jgi:hypothetical protein